MTNYSDIKGYRVKYLSSDPTLNTSTEGQVWYNSTSGTLKSLVQIKAWSSGGNLNTARGYGIGSAGVQTSALAFAGETFPGPIVNVTEEYNGYTWTNATNYPQTVWGVGGFGTQTAAVGYAGVQTAAPTTPTNTNEYDGSTWTAGGAVNQHVRYGASAGILTAGLKSSGGSPATNNTEEYNGTSWTTVNSSNTSAEGRVSAGTQTASIFSGGAPETSIGASVESYDGTTWTSLNDAPFPAAYRRGGGTQTHAVFAGGRNPADSPIYLNSSQEFDGTTFVNTPNMATVRWNGGGSGTDASSNTLLFGGVSAPGAGNISATEEYDSSINTAVAGTWASATNLPISTNGASGGFGASYDSFAMVSPSDKNTYLYDGSTWTTGNPAGPVFSNALSGTSAGTQTAAFMAGERRITPEADLSTAGDWDGTSWTAANPAYSQITATGFGTQTAGGIAGGQQSGVSSTLTTTNLYDGTNWTSSGALNDGRGQMSSTHGGTQTAAVTATGEAGPPGNNKHEHFDGSTWTSQTAIPGANLRFASATGVQTSYLVYAGFSNPVPGATNTTYSWNGTAWVTEGNLATSAYNRGAPSGQTSNAKALAAGVQSSPSGFSNAVEEWTGPTTVAAASTLTTS